jgi:hypothetical protein
MLQVISARVFGPQDDEAWSISHVVKAVLDGEQVYCHLMATDPMEAIKQAQSNKNIHWSKVVSHE